MNEKAVEVVSATVAAEQLGVSASGLRRLGSIYSRVHGELPRERGTEKRIWTSEVIERLGQARTLVEAERYRSIKEALEALDKGIDIDAATDLAQAVEPPPPQALQMLLEQIRAMQTRLVAVETLETRLNALDRVEAEVQALRRQLEAPKDDSRERVLEAQVAELEQRNRAMLGELERRRLEGEKQSTGAPWWRQWFKR